MNERITCGHVDGAGRACGRFLGEISQGQVLIYCPACKTMHHMEITALMRHLQGYLEEMEGQATAGKRRLVGFA